MPVVLGTRSSEYHQRSLGRLSVVFRHAETLQHKPESSPPTAEYPLDIAYETRAFN
jgi:hypothetical protein